MAEFLFLFGFSMSDKHRPVGGTNREQARRNKTTLSFLWFLSFFFHFHLFRLLSTLFLTPNPPLLAHFQGCLRFRHQRSTLHDFQGCSSPFSIALSFGLTQQFSCTTLRASYTSRVIISKGGSDTKTARPARVC